MKHLTDEQLSARLDGELPGRTAGAVEEHLAACAECRERLAGLSGANASLAQALEHDPGEPYFASFAGRVQDRIAAATAADSPRQARADAPSVSRGGWLQRPSTLAWAGAATALVAVGVFAVQFATQQVAVGRKSAEPSSIVGADRLESRQAAPASPTPASPAPAAPAPAAAPEPALLQAPADRETDALSARQQPAQPRSRDERLDQPAPAARAEGGQLKKSRTANEKAAAPLRTDAAAPVRENAAPPVRENAVAAPQRLQELRTLPNGEQVPVQSRALPQDEKQKAFAAAPGDAAKPPKPMAMPMATAPLVKRAVAAPEIHLGGGRSEESKTSLAAPTPAPAPATAPPAAAGTVAQPSEAATGAVLADRVESMATVRLCGKVTDTSGRPLAHAAVTVVETGRSVTADDAGGYCVDAPSTRATLSVMLVGFHEYRERVQPGDGSTPWAVTLRPVQALGESGAPVMRFTSPPGPAVPGQEEVQVQAERRLIAKDQSATAKLATIAPLPGETADAKTAREATEAALRTRTVPMWSKAGALWERVALSAQSEAAANEARYRAAEARMNAWRLARGSSNRRAAAEACDAYLAKAPAGTHRDEVAKWRKELPDR
jgi:hypothetical protein